MLILGSSAIYGVAYIPTTKVLTVWFQHGKHSYDYYGVPQSVYDGLLSAPFKGRYFNLYIRDQYAP